MRWILIALFLTALPLSAAILGDDIGQQLGEAQMFLTSRPDLAAEKLELMLEQYPGQPHLRFMLAQAYSRLERFEEAEAMLMELRAESPDSRGAVRELTRLYLRQGRQDEALAQLDQLLSGRPDARHYMEVAAIYQGIDRFDLAEEIYQRGLEELLPGDDAGRIQLLRQLFAEYELGGRGDAILRVLAPPREWKSENLTRDLMRSADRAFRDMEDCGEFVALADSLSASDQGQRLAPLLRWIYLRADREESYLAECLRAYPDHAIDRMNFLRQEARRQSARPQLARPLWAALADGNGDPSRISEARLALMDLDLAEDARRRLRGLQPDSALAGRLAVLRGENLGHSTNLDLILREQAYLRDRMGRADEAETILREILRDPLRRIRPTELWRLEMELAKDRLAQGDFQTAGRVLASVQRAFPQRERPENPDRRWREQENLRLMARLEAGYQLSLMEAVSGDVAAAQDSLAALAKENPAAALANDALAAALLLAEADAWPEALGELIRRSLDLEIRSRPAEAADLFLPFIEEFPEDEVTPALLYRMGELREKALQGEAALQSWERLAETFPEHHRAAPSLDRGARLALRMGDVPRARALLDRLLENHPSSPLIPGTRELRRELEVDA